MDEDGLTEVSAPYERLIQAESKRVVYAFCTLCSLFEGKKMSIKNIFLQLADNKEYQTLFKKMLSEEDIKECIRIFCLIEPSVLSDRQVKTLIRTWK